MKLLMFEHCSLYFRARMAAGLKSFPRRVRDYFEAMMSRIGFEPQPAV
jgi:glutaredoxin 2